MSAQLISKGVDTENTGLPISIQRTGYFHNEEAKCIEVYYKKIITYPSGKTSELSRERIIIQDLDANGDAPAITKYTDYCTQFHADAIGQAIDNYLTSM